MKNKRWSEASTLYLSLLDSGVEEDDVLHNSIVVFDNAGQYEAMLRVARLLLDRYPFTAPPLAYRARALQKLNRISEATIANDQALLLDTTFPLAWINRGGLQLLQQSSPRHCIAHNVPSNLPPMMPVHGQIEALRSSISTIFMRH